MALSNATADAMVTSMASAMGITDAATIAQMKVQWRIVYSSLKADILITLPAASVVTVGSATTQTGPAAPVPMTPA